MRRHHYKPYLGEGGIVSKPAVTTNGVMARYERFSHSGTTWFDLTPNPANGTGTGFGAGVDWPRFDGAQTINVGQPAKLALTGNMSFVSWASQDAGVSGFERVMSRDGVDRFILSLNDNTGKPFVMLDIGGAKTITGGATTNDGAWHMIAATYDGATLSLYVDGALDGSLAVAGSADIDTAQDLDFGSNKNANAFLEGRIDSCRIYNRSLSADEILRDYYAGVPAHS